MEEWNFILNALDDYILSKKKVYIHRCIKYHINNMYDVDDFNSLELNIYKNHQINMIRERTMK